MPSLRDEKDLELLLLPARRARFAVLDLEMTGLDVESDQVVEIAIVRSDGSSVTKTFTTLVRPTVRMSKGAFKVHGIGKEMLRSAPRFGEVAQEVLQLLNGAVLVAHNVPFDVGFLHREMAAAEVHFDPPVPAVDTLLMARRLFAFPSNRLGSVCERLGVTLTQAHRALGDAQATFEVLHKMLEIVDPSGTMTIGELLELLGTLAPNSPLRMRQRHVISRAHRRRRTVWIDYQSTAHPTQGLVHREVAIWKISLPYIQGWCHLRKGERVFRMDRIRSVEEGDQGYKIPSFKPRI